jgi:hypothetical protein
MKTNRIESLDPEKVSDFPYSHVSELVTYSRKSKIEKVIDFPYSYVNVLFRSIR